MSISSAGTWITGFWEYLWMYPETHLAVYRTATALAAAFGLLMYFDPLFALPAIAAYLLPPMYLYHVEDAPESASGREPEDPGDTDADVDGRDIDIDGDDFDMDSGSDADADADSADADADGADADADGIDVDIDN
jgi:hypothetical protein